MHKFTFVVTGLLLLAATHSYAADEKLSDAERDRVLALVPVLGDLNFHVRQDAEEVLYNAPLAAFELLSAAFRSERDPEIRERLRRVLIQLTFQSCRNSRGRKVTLSLDQQPLKEALHAFSRELGMHAEAFDFLDNETQSRVDVYMKAMEDRYALRWILRTRGIEPEYTLQNEQRVYDLKNLPLAPEQFKQLIIERWFANEFDEENRAAELNGSVLKLKGTTDEHIRLEYILKQIVAQKGSRSIRAKLEDIAWREPLMQMLRDKKVSFDFTDMELPKAIALLQKESGVFLPIDPKLLVEGQFPTITLRVKDMTIDLALDWVLRLADLELSEKDQSLLVTARGIGLGQCEIGFQNVDDLIDVPGDEKALTRLCEMVRTRVRPDSWDPALGTWIESLGGKLVFTQTAEVHQSVADVLENQRSFRAMVKQVEVDGKWPAAPLDPKDVPRERTAASVHDALDELRQKLKKKISFDVTDKELGDLLPEIATAAGVTIVLDPRLAAKGADKTVITLKVSEMNADNALRWVMRMADVEYELHSDAVFIMDRVWTALKHRPYYVRDLQSILEPAELKTVIKERLFPVEFGEMAGSIDEDDGILEVWQSLEVHARIQSMLTYLRLHAGDKILMLHRAAGLKLPDENAGKKLAVAVSCEFDNATIDQVINDLRESSGATLVLDPKLYGQEATLTLQLKDAPLAEALTKVLPAFGATCLETDGALFVTTNEGPRNLECGLYTVEVNGKTVPEVVEHIRTKVAPASWAPGLGGSIEERKGRILIMQTPEVHKLISEEILRLQQSKK
jgi:hypothetical protein